MKGHFPVFALLMACTPDEDPVDRGRDPELVATTPADTDDPTGPGTDTDTGARPLLGSTQWGVGIRHDPAWVEQHGLPGNEETFAIYTGVEGTFIAGTTQSSWYRDFLDPCEDEAHAVARDCGDAVLFNADTLVGIQIGDLASDEVRGLVVVDGEVTFGGRTRAPVSWTMGAYLHRYTADLQTELFAVDLPHAEMLGLAMDRGQHFAVGGTLWDWEPPEVNFGDEDALAWKLDGAGEVVAVQQIGSADFDELHDVQADENGVYISGITQGVLDDDAQGAEDGVLFILTHTLDAAEEICRIQLGTAGRDGAEGVAVHEQYIYIGGNTEGALNSQFEGGSQCYHAGLENLPDAYVAKYDRRCKQVWTRQFGSVLGDAVEAVAVDENYVYATGYANAGVDHQNKPRELTTDAFLRVYTLDGELAGEVMFDGSPSPDDLRTDYARAIAVDDVNVYIGGATDGVMGLTESAGGRDMFMATVPIASVIGNVAYDGDGCDDATAP